MMYSREDRTIYKAVRQDSVPELRREIESPRQFRSYDGQDGEEIDLPHGHPEQHSVENHQRRPGA